MALQVNPVQVQSAMITVMVQLLATLRTSGVFESNAEVRAMLEKAAASNRAESSPINQGAADFIDQVLVKNPLFQDDA